MDQLYMSIVIYMFAVGVPLMCHISQDNYSSPSQYVIMFRCDGRYSKAAIRSSNQPDRFSDSASGGAPLSVSPAGLTLVS